MPSQKNQDQLSDLKAALADSKAAILVDYAGMSVHNINQLRQQVTETGGHFNVVKNSLLALALKDRLDTLSDDALAALEGPTALLLTSQDDPVSPTKALAKFISDNEIPTIKIGVLDDRILTVHEINNLAKLPGRDQLLAMLAAQLNAPISGFAQVLRANLQNLVYALNAIKAQKSENWISINANPVSDGSNINN